MMGPGQAPRTSRQQLGGTKSVDQRMGNQYQLRVLADLMPMGMGPLLLHLLADLQVHVILDLLICAVRKLISVPEIYYTWFQDEFEFVPYKLAFGVQGLDQEQGEESLVDGDQVQRRV